MKIRFGTGTMMPGQWETKASRVRAAPAGWQGVGMPLDGDEPLDTGIPLDTNVPHVARVYDYWLGGKDNFAADRQAAEAVIEVRPTVVRANRAFLRRAAAWLASEAGIRQYLDIRTGIPTKPNVHEVV